MPRFVLHTQKLSDTLKEEVAAMTGAYAADLHRFGFSTMLPANHLLLMYQHCLAWEVVSYLDRIGVMPEAPTELITAHDDSDMLIGYVLYLPAPTHPDACGVSYMAVDDQNRGRGIAKEMMELVKKRYPHVELTCSPAKVPYYQSMGFKMIDWESTQLVMNTRDMSSEGQIAIQDVDPIYNSKQAHDIFMQLVKTYGEKAMRNDQKRLKKHIAEASRRAKAFFQANSAV